MPMMNEANAMSSLLRGLEAASLPASVIEIIPTHESYAARERLLQSYGSLSEPLPPHLPSQTDTPCTWTPENINFDELTYCFSKEDLEEVEAALHNFQCVLENGEASLNSLSPQTFPLPGLRSRLRKISREIHCGRGLFSLRGLCPDRRSVEENVILFAGVSSHIADQRGIQSGENHVNSHIYIEQQGLFDARPAYTADALPFHNDMGDVLALYVVESGGRGGETRLAPGAQIYNDIASTRPGLIRALADANWPHETNKKPAKLREFPLLHMGADGAPFFSASRYDLTGSSLQPRSPDIRPVTEIQMHALDTLAFTADKYAVSMPQQKGDMCFINNRTNLHARNTLRNLSRGSERHYIRLCLRDTELGQPVPRSLQDRWTSVFDHAPGDCRWALQKEHSSKFVSGRQWNALFTDETSHSTS